MLLELHADGLKRKEHLATTVEPWRILCGKQHELGMSLNHLLVLWDVELLVIVQ